MKEITTEFEIVHGLGLGIAFGNTQPKKNYRNARWQLAIMVLCFELLISYNYEYKQK